MNIASSIPIVGRMALPLVLKPYAAQYKHESFHGRNLGPPGGKH
jgi:hypothetical protein